MNAASLDSVVRSFLIDGEHPRNVVADVAHRPRPRARVIVVANEKGGVGKSTLAFHLCAALGDAGRRVAAIDLDPRQRTLTRALTCREGTARRLGLDLPQPRHLTVEQQSGAQLCQEITRIGWDCDDIVIDVAGHDSAMARRAIALADVLVTPVNNSFVDIDLLARFDPFTLEFVAFGPFARLVDELRASRLDMGGAPFDWVVVQNRSRRTGSANERRVDAALRALAPRIGCRLGTAFPERVAYRELFLLGLTHLDLKHIPEFARRQPQACKEILALAHMLRGAKPDATPATRPAVRKNAMARGETIPA